MTVIAEEALVKQIPRAVVHLRAQHRAKRLGLMFGAGISRDLGYPGWDDLVARIGARPEIDSVGILERLKAQGSAGRPVTRSLASITQMLFSRFRDAKIIERGLKSSLSFVDEQLIKSEWLRLIHLELYNTLDHDLRLKKLVDHPYLNSFLQIIKRSPLTINYNFDDSLELMLSSARSEDEKERTRGYETVDRPNSQFRYGNGVIYHPNGYLPAVFENGSSADVVFSDGSFQDQLLSAATGNYVHLSAHLFRNTCLLVGLSLDDSTLQSLLRQNSVRNPGNIHYAIHYTPSAVVRDEETEAAVFRVNFESFGVYTLFLNGDEIRSLAQLIELDEKTFASRYARMKPKFVYYLVGSVGAGKSTAAGNLRNLITYDEWVDERKPDLARPEADVSTEKVPIINEWIAEQFRKKNFALQDCQEGIHVVDRAPLDPLTFGPVEDRAKKAASLLETVTDKNTRRIADGHIIQLDAPKDELRIRNSLKHKYWPDHEYERLLTEINVIYGALPKSVICTTGRSVSAVAREIARVIFLDEYVPVVIQDELAKHAEVASDG